MIWHIPKIYMWYPTTITCGQKCTIWLRRFFRRFITTFFIIDFGIHIRTWRSWFFVVFTAGTLLIGVELVIWVIMHVLYRSTQDQFSIKNIQHLFFLCVGSQILRQIMIVVECTWSSVGFVRMPLVRSEIVPYFSRLQSAQWIAIYSSTKWNYFECRNILEGDIYYPLVRTSKPTCLAPP